MAGNEIEDEGARGLGGALKTNTALAKRNHTFKTQQTQTPAANTQRDESDKDEHKDKEKDKEKDKDKDKDTK